MTTTAAPLPKFTQPVRRTLDPLPDDPEAEWPPATQTQESEPDSSPDASVSGSRIGRLRGLLRPAAPATLPTPISTDGQWTPETAAALAVGALAVVVGLAARLIRLRTAGRAQLRRPTEQQAHEIAGPLSSIAFRHLDLDRWGGDIADIVHAAGATGAYFDAGPLLEPSDVDAGVPENLPEQDL